MPLDVVMTGADLPELARIRKIAAHRFKTRDGEHGLLNSAGRPNFELRRRDDQDGADALRRGVGVRRQVRCDTGKRALGL